MLNFIKQKSVLLIIYNTKSKAYFSLVQPSLEYMSTHYGIPITTLTFCLLKKYKELRAAVRWTLNDYNYCSSVSVMLGLNWPIPYIIYHHPLSNLTTHAVYRNTILYTSTPSPGWTSSASYLPIHCKSEHLQKFYLEWC